MNNLTEVSLLGESLAVEETSNGLECPSCKGGLSSDKAFSITRVQEGLLYNCYRASCGFSGFIPAKGSTQAPAVKVDFIPAEFKPRTYKYSRILLTDEQKEFFRTKFSLTDDELRTSRVMYSPDEVSYTFDLLTLNGYTAGILDRSYTGRKPKTITYWTNNVAKLYYPWSFVPTARSCIILVEDILSAIKVSRYQRSVALLGTHLGEREARELLGMTDTIVLALDPDATEKAIQLSRKYSAWFKRVLVLPSRKDPKDMTDEELKQRFNQRFI